MVTRHLLHLYLERRRWSLAFLRFAVCALRFGIRRCDRGDERDAAAKREDEIERPRQPGRVRTGQSDAVPLVVVVVNTTTSRDRDKID